MDREDKRRYLVVGSVILEIVSPLLRKKLEDDYNTKGFGCLQDFINSLPVKHILFHLRHKNSKCCVDTSYCVNQQSLPINYNQWNRMYTAGSKMHNCHCKYTAKPIFLSDLDLTLLSLILLNCCNLSSDERTLISDLREFKNNYLSHNTDGAISETEYSTLWTDLTTYIEQLDPSKQNDLVIIQNRPLDESLCQYYVTCLLDVHVILEKIDTKIDATSAEIRTTIGNGNTEVMGTIGNSNTELMGTIGKGNAEVMEIIGNSNAEVMETIGRGNAEVMETIGKGNAEVMETIGKGNDEVMETIGKGNAKVMATIGKGNAEVMATIGKGNAEVMGTIGKQTAELLASMAINNVVLMTKIEEVLKNMKFQGCERNTNEQVKARPEPVGENAESLQYNKADTDSMLTVEENLLEDMDRPDPVGENAESLLYNKLDTDSMLTVEGNSLEDLVEKCKRCALTLTDAVHQYGSRASLSNICYMLEPFTSSESQCWIGFVKFYGLMREIRIKSMGYHKKGNPEDGHMYHIIHQLLPPLDFRVGHIAYYFSQRHSLREDVLHQIKKFHNNCKFCGVCYKTAHIQSN